MDNFENIENEVKFDDLNTIDIREILWKIWQNKVIIVLVSVICALAMYVYANAVHRPVYSTSTDIYVLDNSSEGINYSNLQTASQLTSDYVELIKNISVMDRAASALDIEGVTGAYLRGKISVASKSNTRVISIAAYDSDPYLAYMYANAVREAAKISLNSILGNDAVHLVNEAAVPTYAAGSGASRTAMLAFFVAFILCIIVIISATLINDKIKTPADVEKYLGVTVLGTVPLIDSKKKKKKKKAKKIVGGDK